jgi:hypothetical protein
MNSEYSDILMHEAESGSGEWEGLPRIVLTATGLIETLLFTHPANTFRFDEAQKERAAAAIGRIREVLGSGSG